MNEKLMELLEEVQKNEELQAKVKEVKTVEELYSITTQYVDGYSLDELKEGLKFIKSQASESNGELSDEDLEMVAGGSITNKQPNKPIQPSLPYFPLDDWNNWLDWA